MTRRNKQNSKDNPGEPRDETQVKPEYCSCYHVRGNSRYYFTCLKPGPCIHFKTIPIPDTETDEDDESPE